MPLRTMCATTAMIVWPLVVSAQESVTTTVLKPCDRLCELQLIPEGEFGEDHGPGMIEAAFVQGWTDASGRAYLAGDSDAHVQVFGADGSFLRRIGRRGEGPGEIQHVSSLAVTADGAFAILDRQRGMILSFDWTGALRSEVRSHGWLPVGMETVHLEDALAVHHADIPTPDLVGFPLHLVDLETGEVKKSFGSLTGEYPLGSSLDHVIAGGPRRTIWMADRQTYHIELWDTEGDRLLRSLSREAEWFPVVAPSERSHGWAEEPSPMTAAIAADDSLLWVLVLIADERWKEAGETRDDERFFDTMVEVIDWMGGEVVASKRFDRDFYQWVEPGLLGRLETTPDASVRYRTYRVQLEQEQWRRGLGIPANQHRFPAVRGTVQQGPG